MTTPVYLTYNGTDISSSVGWRGLDCIQVLTKENASLKFTVSNGAGQTYPANVVPAIGGTVKLYDPSGIIFGGIVTEVQTTIEGLLITYAVTCSDWGYLLDGTLIKKNYAMMDPADIVADIITNFAPGKGFTTSHVQRGNFLVPSIKFNYQQPTKALQSLAKLIGWDWYVDPNKDIHFFLGDVEGAVSEGGIAPIKIDSTSGNIEWNSLDVDLNLQNMQNSVYVIGGLYSKTFTAANTPDVYTTVAGQVVYSIGYPYDSAYIVVTLDGTSQTVGIDQQADPTTVQVLYNDKNRFVKFTSDPGSGHVLKVYGKAKVPIVAHASNAASIATYGEYQTVIPDLKISTVAEAQQRAQAAILQFGLPVYDVKVNTLVPGCAIGQVIPVNLPALGISNTNLVIKKVEATGYVPGNNAMLRYQIECIGADTVSFTDLMTMLLQQEANQTPVDDSTVNENLEIVAETATLTETVAASSGSSPYKYGPTSPQPRYGFSAYS